MNKILQNWDLKALALLAAFSLWIFVVGIENSIYRMPENLHVQPLNLDYNVSIASVLPSVQVYIKDDKDIEKTVNKADFNVIVDLKGLKAGEYRLPVSVNSVKSQIRVMKVEPSEIDVKLAPSAEKETKVTLRVVGTPQDGYEVKDYKLEFDKAKIIGAQSYLDAVNEVTATLVLNGSESQAINQNVDLGLPEGKKDLSENIRIVPSEILVSLNIVAKLQQKQQKITPVFSGVSDQATWQKLVRLTPTTVTLEGDSKTMDSLNEIKTQPIDVPTLLAQGGTMKIALDLPDGVSLSSGKNEITVKYSNDATERKTLTVAVTVTGKNSAFSVNKITPASANVTLSGPAAIINSLTASDISLNLDLSTIQSLGNIKLSRDNISSPAGLTLIQISPDTVKLE